MGALTSGSTFLTELILLLGTWGILKDEYRVDKISSFFFCNGNIWVSICAKTPTTKWPCVKFDLVGSQTNLNTSKQFSEWSLTNLIINWFSSKLFPFDIFSCTIASWRLYHPYYAYIYIYIYIYIYTKAKKNIYIYIFHCFFFAKKSTQWKSHNIFSSSIGEIFTVLKTSIQNLGSLRLLNLIKTHRESLPNFIVK